MKGQPAIVEGQLTKPVQPEECLWSLDNDAVEITLQKADRMSWWSAVIEGDPAIDTSKVPIFLALCKHTELYPGLRDQISAAFMFI